MNYEEKIRLAKEALNSDSYDKETIEYIFPELEESEDEKIRKKLLKMFNDMERDESILDDYGLDKLKTITWLEKQGESVEINPTEFDTRLQGTYQTPDEIIEECHEDNADRIIDIVTEHGNPSEWNEVDENEYNHILKILNLVAEEQENKGYNNLISSANWLKSIKDRIQSNQSNKPQGKSALEAIKEENVDNANKVEPKFKVGDIVQYITDSSDRRKIEEVDTLCNMYHTDSLLIMFENEDEWRVVVNAEDVEQNPTDKIESMFKVGDWVVRKDGGVFDNDIKFAQITEIDGEKHWFDTGLICLKAEDMRLWTLEDAKDGDILYSKKHNLLWRYKNTKECYYCINLNYNNNNISIGNEIVIPNDVRPASKELRDWQFDKMLQHAFSKINGKKELEKQGEHNPTDNDDKIEPKFHEDDWIVVSGEAILICDIRNNLYDVIFADGEHRLYDTNILDKDSHLWTIEDAKDGDILISWTNKPFIYNGFYNETYVGAYCGLNTFNRIIIADKQDHLHHNWTINKDIRPATKEQRDLLFQKMKDKGYKWINEKKEIIRRI